MMAEVYVNTWWTGPWGSAVRQLYVVMIAGALYYGLDCFLKMPNEGKGAAFVMIQMFVKALEKHIRAWIGGLGKA